MAVMIGHLQVRGPLGDLLQPSPAAIGLLRSGDMAARPSTARSSATTFLRMAAISDQLRRGRSGAAALQAGTDGRYGDHRRGASGAGPPKGGERRRAGHARCRGVRAANGSARAQPALVGLAWRAAAKRRPVLRSGTAQMPDAAVQRFSANGYHAETSMDAIAPKRRYPADAVPVLRLKGRVVRRA